MNRPRNGTAFLTFKVARPTPHCEILKRVTSSHNQPSASGPFYGATQARRPTIKGWASARLQQQRGVQGCFGLLLGFILHTRLRALVGRGTLVSKGRAALFGDASPGARGASWGRLLGASVKQLINLSIFLPFLRNAGKHEALPDSKLGLWRLLVLCYAETG